MLNTMASGKRRRIARDLASLVDVLDHVGAGCFAVLDPFCRSAAICSLRVLSKRLRQDVDNWVDLELGWEFRGGQLLSPPLVDAAARFFRRHRAKTHIQLGNAMASCELLATLVSRQIVSLHCLGTMLSDEDVAILAPQLTGLREFSLTHCTSQITEKTVLRLGAFCLHLQALRITHVEVEKNVERLRLSAYLSRHVPALLLDLHTEGSQPLQQEFCILWPASRVSDAAERDKGSKLEEIEKQGHATFPATASLELSIHLAGAACGGDGRLLSLPKRRDVTLRELSRKEALIALQCTRSGPQLVARALQLFPDGFRLIAVEEGHVDGFARRSTSRWELRHALEVRRVSR